MSALYVRGFGQSLENAKLNVVRHALLLLFAYLFNDEMQITGYDVSNDFFKVY
jgi:hypothetical protein